MPVDPYFLSKDRPRPRPPRRTGSHAAAWLVALAGAGALCGLFAASLSSDAAAKAFLAVAVVLEALIVTALVTVGWKEDGVLGVCYRLRNPLGTSLVGEKTPPMWLAIAWLFVLTLVLAAVVVIRNPAAASGLVPRGRADTPSSP